MTKKVRLWLDNQPLLGVQAVEQWAAADPVGLLKESQDRHRAGQTGGRLAGWENTVACYASAISIRDQPGLWKDLVESDFFHFRQNDPKPKDVLRYAILVGTNATVGGIDYQRGCYKARKLMPSFEKSVSASDVLAMIRNAKGLAGLNRKLDIFEQSPSQAPENEHARGKQLSREKKRNNQPKPVDEQQMVTLEVEFPKAMAQEILSSKDICRKMLIIEQYCLKGDWQHIRAISCQHVAPETDREISGHS